MLGLSFLNLGRRHKIKFARGQAIFGNLGRFQGKLLDQELEDRRHLESILELNDHFALQQQLSFRSIAKSKLPYRRGTQQLIDRQSNRPGGTHHDTGGSMIANLANRSQAPEQKTAMVPRPAPIGSN